MPFSRSRLPAEDGETHQRPDVPVASTPSPRASRWTVRTSRRTRPTRQRRVRRRAARPAVEVRQVVSRSCSSPPRHSQRPVVVPGRRNASFRTHRRHSRGRGCPPKAVIPQGFWRQRCRRVAARHEAVGVPEDLVPSRHRRTCRYRGRVGLRRLGDTAEGARRPLTPFAQIGSSTRPPSSVVSMAQRSLTKLEQQK